jgi:hypothetical protein
MSNNTFLMTVRGLFVKLGIAMFCVGFGLATLIFVLGFTGFQPDWIWPDSIWYERLVKLNLTLIMGGITIVFAFGTWVIFETSTRKTEILNIVFNYAILLITFGGGAIFLIASFLLSNADVALTGMRCYIAGVFMLIVRQSVVRFFLR